MSTSTFLLSTAEANLSSSRNAAQTTHSLGTVGAGKLSLGNNASLVKLNQQQVRPLGSNPAAVPVPLIATAMKQRNGGGITKKKADVIGGNRTCRGYL